MNNEKMGNLCTLTTTNKELTNATDKLKNIKSETEVPYFTFNNMTFYGIPCHVYDGDTFSLIFEFNNNIIKYKCRCIGYDTAEMKPKLNVPNREKEIELAHKAKARFIELLSKHPSKLVKVDCLNFDKYGRILVNVSNMVDTKSINEIMIEEGHGKPYSGGTKEEW